MSNRITIQDLNSYRFLKVPKELIFNLNKYQNLSPQAILLYGILHDRLELSAKNGWINENGEIYLKFRKEVVMKLLRVGSKTTITKIFKELKNAELIEEKQVGCNMANEIYLLHAEFSAVSVTDEEILDLSKKNNEKFNKINGSTENGRPKNVRSEVQKMYASDTNSTKTNLEEEEPLQQIYNSYAEVKEKKISYYDRKKLSELADTYSKDIIIKAIEMMGDRADKPNLLYLKNTLKDWQEQNLTTIELIEKHFAKNEVTKNDAKKNDQKKKERTAQGKPPIKKDNFNNYDQRKYTSEQFAEMEKALQPDIDVIDGEALLEQIKNKSKEVKG